MHKGSRQLQAAAAAEVGEQLVQGHRAVELLAAAADRTCSRVENRYQLGSISTHQDTATEATTCMATMNDWTSQRADQRRPDCLEAKMTMLCTMRVGGEN